MIHIPTNNIKQPQLHADKLGFTFVWQGHFLRGIFPQSVEQAKSYFDSGFIDEVVSKRLFPKTWVSDFENEQFGIILEHEFIQPVIYSTEWNTAMLKDAALLVLDIAEIGWKYGYNMVDCHKLNVMFHKNRPVYVDLGSFVPKDQGCTGWNPYTSFLRSYYYILKMWVSGAPVLAKRMMAPGLEMPTQDFYAFKSSFYRIFPSCVKFKYFIQEGLCRIAVWGNSEVTNRGRLVVFFKPLVNFLKPSKSQRLGSLRRNLRKIKIPALTQTFPQERNTRVEALVDVIESHFKDVQTVTFIDNMKSGYYDILSQRCHIERIISVQQDNNSSCREYLTSKYGWILTSVNLKLINNTILVRNKLPETRLQSDLALITNLKLQDGEFGIHNSLVFIEHCLLYATYALIIGVESESQKIVDHLTCSHNVKYVPINIESEREAGYIIVYK